jgi:REP element-mobilizing transposase RayT
LRAVVFFDSGGTVLLSRKEKSVTIIGEVIKMPRVARQKSVSGIYHIIIRGINKQIIFEDKEDREKYLEIVQHYKQIDGYQIYGYCLMDNHVHLLVREGRDVSQSMKRIGISYVYWYNKKYNRSGHLFQDRFKSEAVESDEYFLTVLKYIHYNPMKAGLTKNIDQYEWSSYKEYIYRKKIADVDFSLGIFSQKKENAVREFEKYMKENNVLDCLDIEIGKRVMDEEAIKIVMRLAKVSTPFEIQSMEKSKRDEILKTIKEIKGISTRQIARITGLSQSVIARS